MLQPRDIGPCQVQYLVANAADADQADERDLTARKKRRTRCVVDCLGKSAQGKLFISWFFCFCS